MWQFKLKDEDKSKQKEFDPTPEFIKADDYVMSTNIAELEGCKPEPIQTWVDATKEFGVYD